MKQLKVTIEIADVRNYGTLDNVGKANLVIDYSSEAFLKTARDLVTEEALSLLINAAKDAHFELIEKVEEDRDATWVQAAPEIGIVEKQEEN